MTTLLPTGVMVIEGDTHASQWVRDNGGRFGRGSDAAMEAVLSVLKAGDTVVDVGCNIGGHAWFYAQAVGPQGSVIGYDPNPDCFACARYNCPTGHFYCCALSDHTESGHLVVLPNVGASHLADGGMPCWVTTLDLHQYNLDSLDVLKIDAEGSEIEVIRGARGLIVRFHPVMVIEVNRHALGRYGHQTGDLLREVVQMGYVFENLPAGTLPDSEQYDILCRHVSP